MPVVMARLISASVQLADALGLARGDVARDRHAPRPREVAATFGQRILEIDVALVHRRMAFHAMADSGEVEAALERVGHRCRIGRLLGTGENLARRRHLINGIRDLVADRLERAQIGDDRVHVGVGDDVVEAGRHHRRDGNAARPHAGAQQLLDVGVAPRADAGFLVGRDVRRGDVERRLVKAQAAGKILARDHVRRTFGRMAIAAGHDGVDEIRAALDRRIGASPADECQRGKGECCKPQHDAPSRFLIPAPGLLLWQRAPAANQTCVVRANVSSCGHGAQQKGQRRCPQ